MLLLGLVLLAAAVNWKYRLGIMGPLNVAKIEIFADIILNIVINIFIYAKK